MKEIQESMALLALAPLESWTSAALAYYSLALGRWLLLLWAVR